MERCRSSNMGGQLLVANDNYIFAAYNPRTDAVTHYYNLPFTIWEGQGKIVDSYRFSDKKAWMRKDFPHKHEQTSQPGAPADAKRPRRRA